MKKTITLTLGLVLSLPTFLFGLNAPTVVWPNVDNYYVAPGNNQLFQFQSHVHNCNTTATLYSVTQGIQTVISTQTVYCEKKYNHIDLYFEIPECLLTENLRIGFRNSKNGNFSSETFRNLKSDLMQIPVSYTIPMIQFKCEDEPWEPIQPRGTIISYNSTNYDATQLFGGLVNYYNYYDASNSTVIKSTNNYQGFSPYLLPISTTQQELSGTYKYLVKGNTACQIDNPTAGTMSFLRFNINYLIPDKFLEGHLVNPDLIPCSDRVKCNVPFLTYFPLPGPGQIVSNAVVEETHYYYLDNNNQKLENQRMSSMGTTHFLGSLIQLKKVCFDDLKNSQGVPEICNYLIEYTLRVSIPTPYPPYFESTTCKIEVPITVYPVNSQAMASTYAAYNQLVSAFNNVKSQFANVPGISDDFICDLIYTIYDVISSDLSKEKIIELDQNFELQVSEDNEILSLISSLEKLENPPTRFFWNKGTELYSDDLFTSFSQFGRYSLYAVRSGISIKIFDLGLLPNHKPSKLSDLISEEDLINLRSAISDQSDFYSKLFESKSTLENYTPSPEILFTKPKSPDYQIAISPNPSDGTFNLTLPEYSIHKVKSRIYSLDGKGVDFLLEPINNSDKFKITVLDPIPGIYILELINVSTQELKAIKIQIR